MALVSSVSYKYQINGFLSNCLIPQRGLRQGDPLSPYLFILIFDVLSRLLSLKRANNVISGIEVAPGFPLTHLFFADDAILFAKASKEELYSLMSTLNLFSKASGQRINLLKSGIVFSFDVPGRVIPALADVLHIPVWEHAGNYLGVPAEWGRSKVKSLQWIKDKVLSKMEGWKEKLLNQAGKEVLIKAVVQAIPSYVMSLVSLPKTFCRSLCSMVARFWWKAEGKSRGIHWKSWQVLSSSKDQGVMGFKDFEEMNIALLAKQAWRLVQNPDSLWATNLLKLYCSKDSFWSVKKRNGDSWLWSSLLLGRDLLKKQGCWTVGDGASIDISNDKWLASGAIAKLNDPTNAPKLSVCIDSVNKQWDVQKVAQVFHHDTAMETLKTPISVCGGVDAFWWPLTMDGCYSVKSGYFVSHSEAQAKPIGPSSSVVISKEFWNGIWSALVPQKVKNFIWRLSHNALPLRQNLCKKRLASDPMCPICANEVESVEHSFLLCPWVTPLWFGLQQCSVPTGLTVTSCISWLSNFLEKDGADSSPNPDKVALIFIALWYIWKARNSFVFEDKAPDPRGTLELIFALANDCIGLKINNIATSVPGISNRQPMAVWKPPALGAFKCDTDASFLQHNGRVYGGYIIRDEKGNLISGNTYKGLATSPLMAEALVLRDALIFADNLQLESVVFESDNLILVQACRKEKIVRNIINITEDIAAIKSHIGLASFTWTGRDSNQGAHTVAELCRLNRLPARWIRSPPMVLRDVLEREKLKDEAIPSVNLVGEEAFN